MRRRAADMSGALSGDRFRESKHKTGHSGANGPSADCESLWRAGMFLKHDGYRLQVRRIGDTVRLFTRRGYDWSARYPAISVTATLLRARSFTLDGEAVVCGPQGVAVFDALHRRGTVSEAMLYAFDLLDLDGEDLRGLPLGDRRRQLARLLGRRRLGIVLSDHTDEDGAAIFQQACKMGLEGIVSKRLSAPYRSGRSKDWIKVKNPDSPAMIRAREAEW
jgi:bifunctional non-homologous end joining protein LigD